MKTLLFLLTTLSFQAAFAAETSEWGDLNCGLRLSASNAVPAAKLGKPVIIAVRIKNVSEETLQFFETIPQHDFTVAIYGSSGSPLPAKPMPGNDGEARRHTVKIGPNEILESKFDLNEFCEITDAGTYKVVVKRKIHVGGKSCEVASKPLNVSISR